MSQCPFCNNEIIDTQSIYSTDKVNVLYNIRPGKNYGRCLATPKRHVETLAELTEEEAKELFAVVWLISKKLRTELNPIAMNYGFNEGEFAGQSVPHLHFHIMPRYKDDGMPEYHLFHRPDDKKRNLTPEEMSKYVNEFRKLLKE